jgi:hypothetical protein
MLARRHHHPQPRAGVDVDMRIDAALADQPQLRQSLQQRRADLRALAKQHQSLGVAQPVGQHIDILHVVVPDRHLVPGELAEARQAAQRIEPVVEDRDFHAVLPMGGARAVLLRNTAGGSIDNRKLRSPQ